MMSREEKKEKISESQRYSTVALLVIAAVVVIFVAWAGFGTLAKYLLWIAGIFAVIIGAYFWYLRYRD